MTWPLSTWNAWFICMLCVIALASCGSHEHGEGGDHAEHSEGDDAHAGHAGHDGHAAHGDESGAAELEAIAITVWTDKTELFAEHPPAVAGQTLSFLAHLTILDDFQALRQATVTLRLEGPERVEARVTETLRPGIFRPTLTAPRAGTYQATLTIEGPELQDTLAGFQVTVHGSSADALVAQEQVAAAAPTVGIEPIVYLKEQQWQVTFATEFASERELSPVVEVSGEVTAPPSGQADVGAALSGRVMLPRSGLPRPGQLVRRGELLATIAPSPSSPEAATNAQLGVLEAEVRVETAQAAVARTSELLADRAIPERQAENAQRELRVALESLRAAQRTRQLFATATSGRGAGLYRIVAPIDGVVVEVRATAGGSVSAGDSLFRIVDFSELWVVARVPEQQAVDLRADRNASFRTPGTDTWLPIRVTDGDATASIVSVGRVVDPHSRSVQVIYSLQVPDPSVRLGALVEVGVPVGDAWRGVVVPREALVADDGRTVVYVQVEGEAFEERPVELGPSAGSAVGIVRGVSPGERIVLRGASMIRLASRASSTPSHGHVH